MLYFIKNTAKTFLQFAVKSLFVFGLVMAVVLVGTTYFFSRTEEVTQDNTFDVTGTAKRLVTPDIAEITIGTLVRGKDIAKIQAEATDKINAAIEKVKALEIPEEDIQTSSYNLTPERKVGSNEIDAYSVDVSVKVTVRNTKTEDELVGKVIAAGTSAGLNEVRSLYFMVDDEQAILDELKLEAVDDAKARADALAEKAGLKLGKLLNVNEGYTPYYYGYSEGGRGVAPDVAVDDAKNVQVQPGQFELSSTVTLVYKIK